MKGRRVTVISSLIRMREWADVNGKNCGLVPTLGALHDGHASLIQAARSESKKVAVSIFINPLQFRRKQYLLYPSDLASDITFARNVGADIVFAPSAQEMYPSGFDTRIILPSLFKRLRRQKLQWHYTGVLAVVMKLFQLVRPRTAYFGLKDPHQLALIKKMVLDFNVPVLIRECPTVREKDGLARSSRNALLTGTERAAAPVIYRALLSGREFLLKRGKEETDEAVSVMKEIITRENLARIDYLEIVDPLTFAPLNGNSTEALISAAVWVGNKRLADNLRFRLK